MNPLGWMLSNCRALVSFVWTICFRLICYLEHKEYYCFVLVA